MPPGGASLGLVRDTSGHVMLAVRTVNDHCRWPRGAGAQTDCAVARSRPGDRSGLLRHQPASARTVNQVGSDGWELVALQEHREGGMSTSYWDAVCLVATYTFKRPVPSSG